MNEAGDSVDAHLGYVNVTNLVDVRAKVEKQEGTGEKGSEKSQNKRGASSAPLFLHRKIVWKTTLLFSPSA
jgi:hypothetical protein